MSLLLRLHLLVHLVDGLLGDILRGDVVELVGDGGTSSLTDAAKMVAKLAALGATRWLHLRVLRGAIVATFEINLDSLFFLLNRRLDRLFDQTNRLSLRISFGGGAARRLGRRHLAVSV